MAALEAVRDEAARRMTSAGLPLTVEQMQLKAVDREEGNGTSSEWVAVRISGITQDSAVMAIRDETVPHLPLGFGEQLGPLAERLASETDLGTPKEFGFMPRAVGAEGVLARYLTQWAVHYLTRLEDVGEPDPELAERLVNEFIELIESDSITHVRQLTVQGLRVHEQLEQVRLAL